MTIVPIQRPAPSFGHMYEELLWGLLRRGVRELNERTGHTVLSLPYPTSFSIDLGERLQVPIAGNRRLYPATAAAELAWMLMGTQDASFMLKHAKVVWEKFIEYDPAARDLDGEVPLVKAAYGYRWRRHFGRDQLQLAVDALRENPSDRRVWISAWDPAEDGLGAKGQLNVPCPVGFSFSIVDGRLNSALVLRSSDVFVGLPYDVMGHSMLMAVVAYDLGVRVGTMHVTLAHPHLYDTHEEMAGESLKAGYKGTAVPLCRRTIDGVVSDPEGFVKEYYTLGKLATWAAYAPRPDVIP